MRMAHQTWRFICKIVVHLQRPTSKALFESNKSSSPLLKYLIGKENRGASVVIAHRGPKFTLARRICLLAFSITDSEAFFDFFHYYKIVQNQSDKPSQTTVSTTALVDVCESFEVDCYVVDMWTNGYDHQNCINLSVHFIDKLWNLHVVSLGTDPLERPHTAVRIENLIEEKRR